MATGSARASTIIVPTMAPSSCHPKQGDRRIAATAHSIEKRNGAPDGRRAPDVTCTVTSVTQHPADAAADQPADGTGYPKQQHEEKDANAHALARVARRRRYLRRHADEKHRAGQAHGEGGPDRCQTK